jgi:alkane 1-monooxygenase
MHILKTENSSFLSVKNEMLFYILFQGLYLSTLFYFLGVEAIYFGVAVGVLSFLFLETINYIEHYGLQRNKTEYGRYERVQTKHSWNSNHIIGRIVLYELTRHSDHHFKASKKYPFGYPTSILLALVPPLWFRLMNSRIPKAMIPSV